jgi:hypothetical protein
MDEEAGNSSGKGRVFESPFRKVKSGRLDFGEDCVCEDFFVVTYKMTKTLSFSLGISFASS